MRTLSAALAFFLFTSAATAQEGKEQVAKSKIISAGLFKNGLAVIKREINLPGAGTYRLEDLPEPVHGTWWVESTGVVETTTKMREVGRGRSWSCQPRRPTTLTRNSGER